MPVCCKNEWLGEGSELSCGEANKEGAVIGLNLCVIGCAVPAKLTAFCAAVGNDVAVAGIGLGADGLHLTAAFVCAVTGVDVNVERPEAEGAVVSGG